MFDITCCIDYQNIRLDLIISTGRNFPEGTDFLPYEESSDWYILKYYAHKEPQHNWTNSQNGIQLLVLGQVFFRLDSPYVKIPLADVLKEVVSLYQRKGNAVSKFIKGNYILFFFNKEQQSLEIITSKSCFYDLYFAKWNGTYCFSTSLENVLAIDSGLKSINPISLIEHNIFDYPLGNKCLYDKVNWLAQGSTFFVSKERFKVQPWFDWKKELVDARQNYNWTETHKLTPDLFNGILAQQIEGKNSAISAFTSGFDSRTVLAGLQHLNFKNVTYYSWGKTGSNDVEIPKSIAKELSLQYQPLYMDDNFLNEYITRTGEAIRCSDGRASLRRANHFYSYRKLSQFSHINFTGLFGSEVLRPISAIGHTFNRNFLNIFLSKEPVEEIKKIYTAEQDKGYLQKQFFAKHEEDFIADTLLYFKELKENLPDYLALYYFHLKEGFIKYFGHEVHGTRFYVTTYSPYIDDEFIEFILKTPVLALNKKSFELNFRKDLWNTRQGQLFYLPIIQKDAPELMKMKTGRLFSPEQLISSLYPLSIIPALIRFRLASAKSRSFGSEDWVKIFNKQNEKLALLSDNVFAVLPKYDKTSFENYAKQMSIRYWIDITG